MVAPIAALAPIITAVGRFAVPYLAKELGKIGSNKFVQTYGNEAFTSLNETLTKNTTMVNPEAMPMVNPNFMSKKDEEDKTPTVVSEDKTKQPQKQPPEGPDLGTELATEAALQVSKKLSESEQTEKALKPKVEFGPLTETEKQTAKALKEGKSDFYSRAVESIKNAKQNKFTKGKWKSIVQSNSTKDEMDYLGLTEYLKGNESITKEELLKFVEKKDITPNITVRSIPKDEMNKMYETYSLGGYTADTQEHIVFQYRPYKEIKNPYLREPEKQKSKMKLVEYDSPLFKSEHFDTEYGTNTFAHARTQVGYDPLEGEMDRYQDLNNEEIEEAFKNTLIVDEIQSDYIQRGQDKGFIGDFDIVPEDKLIEYLEKNNIFYKLSKTPNIPEFTDKESGFDVIEFQQSGPIKPGDAPILDTLNVGYDKNFIFNKSDKTHYVTTGEDINPVQYLIDEGKVPDFPIKESKKFVELVLNKMIEKAVLDGRDSIAITNGQIQANRYDAMGEEEKEGLKKFYDEIVFKQLEKIADKYNVKLEKVDIREPEEDPQDKQDAIQIEFPRRIKGAQNLDFKLQKLSGEMLSELVNNRDLPDHASIYSAEGRGQGYDYIMNRLVNEKQLEDNYYVWTKETISEDLDNLNLNKDFKSVVWELPLVPVNDTITNPAVKEIINVSPERREYLFRQFTVGGSEGYPYEGNNINNIDLIKYTEYLRNYKLPEGVDLGYDEDVEQLIKMKLPKKLQKEKLSKPIKLTKAKTQTDRLFT
tara:strand:+ start:47 stop:2320 length:2274 start_codon:yes stop_codon:yes gene_type:complete